jgi:ParB family chromosome partitioning protein
MKRDLHYVDDIFHDGEEVVGRFLPIDDIEPNPDQPRQNIGDLADLAASIREKGVLEPLIVRPHGRGYQIVAGERRWRACKQVGVEKVPCIIKEVDEKEMLELALIENLQRKDLTPFEEAEGLAALGEKFGYTHAQIAQVIGKSRTSVTESLSLNQMPSEIRELCRQADISSKSLLLQIVREPDAEAMRALIGRIREGNLTRNDVRKEKVHERKRPKPFIYHFNEKHFSLNIRFNKSQVTSKEVKEALESALESLDD